MAANLPSRVVFTLIDDLIGKPFKSGGRGPDNYDCWGLAMEVYKRFGIDLPDFSICAMDAARIAEEVENQRSQWVKVEGEPPVPSLVLMKLNSRWNNHIGVYIGQGRFIHARAKANSCIDTIDNPRCGAQIEGIYVRR